MYDLMNNRITDDLTSLLGTLPLEIADAIREIGRSDELLEVIIDLGRVPTARLVDGEHTLLDREVSAEEISVVVENVGDFDADNRAGIERTLHRISGIRNRRGQVVGLTLRVGRAVFGTIEIIEDIIVSGQSILFLGKPGVGKTTMLREAARVLADTKRVVIVDTSNEIGGDGDIPHPAVGKARRMQVPTPSLQHEVMIEAVENHNPEVIIIDEIGRELEALAARTIAERGVQLIGTAHGITLDNLLLNPTLSDLVGGIESVTLSDEEARRRGTQKTVLERRAPPTFDVLVELQDRDVLNIHPNVSTSVDSLLRGRELDPEVRTRDAHGDIHIQSGSVPSGKRSQNGRNQKTRSHNNGEATVTRSTRFTEEIEVQEPILRDSETGKLRPLKIVPYGVARNRLLESAKRLRVPLAVVDRIDEADALLTLKNFYRRRPRQIVDAEARGVPIYVLRSNTVTQMEDFLVDVFEVQLNENDPLALALREARDGIERVRNGTDQIDLAPQKASIRRQQHELARQADLISHSYGQEPERYVRIYRE